MSALFNLLTGLVLLLAGSALLFVLLRSLLEPLLGRDFLSWFKPSPLVKAARQVKKAQELMDGGQPLQALKELRKACIVRPPRLNAAELRLLKEHHQNILSRALVIAEETGSRARNIALVERMFLEQVELLLMQHKTSYAYSRLRHRRRESGKKVPEWSRGDYKKKLESLAKDLKRNQRELQRALDDFFVALAVPDREDIVYH